jgi:hypothetical protein
MKRFLYIYLHKKSMLYFLYSYRFSACWCILVLMLLNSCAGTGPGKSIGSVDYIQVYHPLIKNAELNIVDHNFKEALQLYQQAFTAVPEPFALDYYNAAVSALLADDQNQAFKYLDKLVLKGVSLDYLKRQEILTPLQDTKNWRKFEKSYDKYRARFEEKANLDLRADLDELYAKDQYYRQAKGGLKVHGDTIKKIENNNVDFLLTVIEEHGYPGENLIGVADTLEQLPRFSIVIQRQTKAKSGYNFESILKKAVQAGRMRPQVAAYLLEQQGYGMFKTRAFVTVACNNPKNCKGSDMEGKYFTDKVSGKPLEQLNESRKLLGLHSLEDYRKTVLYNKQDKRFKLSNYWSVTNYVVPSKEAANALTENLTLADLNN